jgi:hypothetical protein
VPFTTAQCCLRYYDALEYAAGQSSIGNALSALWVLKNKRDQRIVDESKHRRDAWGSKWAKYRSNSVESAGLRSTRADASISRSRMELASASHVLSEKLHARGSSGTIGRIEIVHAAEAARREFETRTLGGPSNSWISLTAYTPSSLKALQRSVNARDLVS